jgi:hypothetical protein
MRPYCCPVCCGRGFVPHGFYRMIPTGVYSPSSTSAMPERCRSCSGSGVVWGRGADDHPFDPQVRISPAPVTGGQTVTIVNPQKSSAYVASVVHRMS